MGPHEQPVNLINTLRKLSGNLFLFRTNTVWQSASVQTKHPRGARRLRTPAQSIHVLPGECVTIRSFAPARHRKPKRNGCRSPGINKTCAPPSPWAAAHTAMPNCPSNAARNGLTPAIGYVWLIGVNLQLIAMNRRIIPSPSTPDACLIHPLFWHSQLGSVWFAPLSFNRC
jgi:hypothetical protein